MEICFDTSTINALCDDPESGKLIAKIKSAHRVLLTSINVVEVVANADEQRRHLLLHCMKSLSDGLPLAMPNKIVRRATRAFAKGKKKLAITITQDDSPLWAVVNDPSQAGTEQQAEALQWKRSLEDSFLQSHRDARDSLRDTLSWSPQSRPRSAGMLIKSFREEGDSLYGLVKEVFRKETSQYLSRDAMWQLFKRAPEWPLFLAGWGHEIFARVLQESRYGPKGKPGTLDLWCAVYLPVCDVFVTNDNGQHRALRLLNVLSSRIGDPPMPKTRVLKYVAFRRVLVE